ncbi:MAG: hypothetical protein M1826_004306 [Phylliscum demangeonii]|nr:MAG: hypothetical protein M1826_004306 [Phylliscum demangeonii]
MVEEEVVLTFGAELKDAFKPVNAWVSNGIAWLDDIQQYYRDRSAIERDYSAKLGSLAKKYFEKKAKKSSSLSVGDSPHLTPGSLESASLTTWAAQLSTLEARAAEHDRLAAELVTRCADPLKTLGGKYEEMRKRHAEYGARLERDRDQAYADLKRVKAGYDAVCQDVESRRKKVDAAMDSGKPKAQNAYQQQMLDMHNVKNTYLIAINVTNALKARYYHEYVPELLDSLQELSESRTSRLNQVWSTAAQLERSLLAKGLESLDVLLEKIPRNYPRLDSVMLIRHNAPPWREPPDLAFEPSPVWHDDGHMVVDANATVFLRNLMAKSKAQIGDLRREVDTRRKEVDATKRTRDLIRQGRDKRDEIEVVSAILAQQDALHQLDHKRLAAEVEMASITAAVGGDVTRGARGHAFRPQTFKIPTNCDLCGDRIWGLSAKGFDCRDCGYTCHNKCEMKVPATCPGEQTKDERRKLKGERQEASQAAHRSAHAPAHANGAAPAAVAELPTSLSRSNTMNSLSSGYATSALRSLSRGGLPPSTEDVGSHGGPAAPPPHAATPTPPGTVRRHRILAPPPATVISELPANGAGAAATADPRRERGEPAGQMAYAYQAHGAGEISVGEGDAVVVVEADDGSGWTKVRTVAGAVEGVVPTSYVELSTTAMRAPLRPDSSYSSSSTSLAGSLTGASKKKGPAVAPKKGAKRLNYVGALYDYDARTEAEWSMREGERFVLVNRDAGHGWSDVEKGGVVKSVPANYLQDVV